MASPRVAATRKFVEAFGKMEKDTLLSMLTPTFTYTYAPSSVPLPPPMNSEGWSGFLDNMRAVMEGYPLTIKTIIDCGGAENKTVVWATGEAQIKEELMDDGLSKEEWKYTGEYMIVFSWAEGGKLGAVFEFTDSKGVEKFLPLMQRAGTNLQKSMEKVK